MNGSTYTICICREEKSYLKGDWSWWSKICEFCQKQGYGSEIFIKHTVRHKIRLWLGMNGQAHDGSYYFGSPLKSKILNWIIGYKSL